METHVYKTVNGNRIEADIFAAKAEQPIPAVVFIHGGGLVMGSRKAVPPGYIPAFNEAGYHWVSVDYRLAPETKLPEILRDIEDAWTWLMHGQSVVAIEQKGSVVLGHSAGAYLALTCGYRVEPKPAGIVSIAGFGRLTTTEFAAPSPHYLGKFPSVDERDARRAIGSKALSESGPGDSIQFFTGRGLFYLFCRQQGIWLPEIGGKPVGDSRWFEAYEPFCNVAADFPPTLLLHGGADVDVSIAESEEMASRLTDHGVQNELLSNPRWGHAFIYGDAGHSSEDQIPRRIIDFLETSIQ